MTVRIALGFIIACLFGGNFVHAQTTLYPDPSVLRVSGDYYLVNSTFAYFPGIPVFQSKDLKNWKQIGNVISRPSQMNFMGHRMTRGLFAPAIDYHKGTFYATGTLIVHGVILTLKHQ